MPPFGHGVIRRFSDNASEMKRLAAQDFEDILQVGVFGSSRLPLQLMMLQCSIPIFEGLFPPAHEGLVKTVLYHCAEWHALAKLWMHTESSLSHLDKACRHLSYILWRLKTETAQAYHTFELPREYKACWRRMQAEDPLKNGQSSTPRAKGLNLHTIRHCRFLHNSDCTSHCFYIFLFSFF